MSTGMTEAVGPAIPLALARPGRPVRLFRVDGCDLQSRLASMGFVSGTIFEVVSGALDAPVIVALNGTRVMLGRGAAQRIQVRECPC